MNKLNFILVFAVLILLAVPLGFADDSSTTSSTISVAVKIKPHTAYGSSTLHCVVSAGGSGYTYFWYRNGHSVDISGAYVQPSYTHVGDTWKCVVKKFFPVVGWVTIGKDSAYINAKPVQNQPPAVDIIMPNNGDSFNLNTLINFTGTANDPEQGAITNPANLVWTSNNTGVMGYGQSISVSSLPAGLHNITLTATDKQGAQGSDSIIIAINSTINHAPIATIITPDNGSAFSQGQAISFTGSGFDIEDGVLSGNSLVWTSDIDGNFANGTSADVNTLSVGTHTITLTAADSMGATGTDSITIIITVGPINTPPVVTITSPPTGSLFTPGTLIQFTGTAVDPEDGAITNPAQLIWSSNNSGNFGFGTSVNYSLLGIGSHAITLTATDSQGLSANASIIIYVNATANTPPVVNIIVPLDGANFSCNSMVNFQGTATDADNDTLDLAWFSGLSGLAFGTGNLTNYVFPVCNQSIQINFTADDRHGGTALDTIIINILPNQTTNNPPQGRILSPLNGQQFIECQNIFFNATAYDVEGIRSTTWFYNGNPEDGNTSFTRPASYFGVGNHTITFTVIDTDGNVNTSTATFEVIGHQAPTITITQPLNDSNWNLGDLINFVANAVNNDAVCPTNFTWIWRDNSVPIWTTSSSFSTSNLSAGNHTITAYAVDNYNQSGADQIVIHVNEIPNILPVVTIDSPAMGDTFIDSCQFVTFSATASDADGNITRYQWIWNSNIINDSASFTLPASYFGDGNQTVTLIVTDNRNGQNSTGVNFTVIPHLAPTITITAPLNGTNFTEGAPVDFTAVAVPNDLCAVNFSYTWTDVATILSNLPSFTISNLSVGQHTLVARADDTLGLFDTDSVTINILAIPNIPPVINSIVCYNSTGGTVLNEKEPLTCVADAIDSDGNITSWVWSVVNFYGPTFSNNTYNIPYPYLQNGTYNVSLTVQDDDLNQTTLTVPIVVNNNAPTVTLASNVTNGIEPLRVLFTCSVSGGNKPYSYSFDFGNGVTDVYVGNETSLNFTINYPQNGTYIATCTVTDSDGDAGSNSITIDVYDTVPQGDFNFTPPMPYECSNVTFTSNVSAYDGILSYFWNFMDGGNSTAANPVHNFTQDGNYGVTLTVTDFDNSAANFMHTVPVQDTVPLVEAGPDRNVTEGNNLTFVGSAIPTCDPIVDYEWNFGDGTPVQNGQLASHNFTQNGTYTVTFTAIDSDGSRVSDTLTVVVFDTVPDAIGVITPNPVMEGHQATLDASISTGYDQPLSYQWNINGTILNGMVLNYTFPTYLTNSPVILPVVLTVTDSDGSTDNQTIIMVVLDSVPTANATLVTPDPIYEGDVVTFDSSISIGYDLPLNYTWYFGDGNVTTTQNTVITHVYQQNASYLVRLVVTDADGSTDDDYLNVNVLDTVPTPAFSWVPASPFEGFQVNFTDLSTIPAFDNITAWMWNFGDGNTSTVQNATHIYKYEGTYNVTLSVMDFDDSTWTSLTQQITVQNLAPIMTFTATPASGNELLNVLFNCSASGNAPFTFTLAFGDGTNVSVLSSTRVTSTKAYLNGTYTATCLVVDNDGDSISQPLTVVVNDLSPNASLSGNITVYEGGIGYFDASNSTSYPDAIIRYEWDWDYTGVFNADDTTGTPYANHTFYIAGPVTVAVRVIDSDGSGSVATLAVNVINLPPTANFTQNYYSANESENVTFTASGSDPGDGFDAITYQWDWDYNGTFNIDESTLVNTTIHTWPDDFAIPFMVAVRGVDSYALPGNVSTALVKINNVPPVPSLNLPFYICNNDSLSNSSVITLFGTVFDPGADEWTYLWNITNGAFSQYYFEINQNRMSNLTFNCGGKPLGFYNVTLDVRDDDHGNGTATAVISVTNGTGNNPPTVVSPFENETIAASVATPLVINLLAYDSDGNFITIDNNASLTLQNVNQTGGVYSAQLTFLPTTVGLIRVGLTACDDSGYPNNCSIRQFTINVTQPNIPPTAIVFANAGQEGIALTLDGTGSFDLDDTIATWMWDFGDGNTLNTTLPTIQHTYTDNASYLAVLRVVDSRGAISNPAFAGVYVMDVPPAVSGPGTVTFNEDSSATITITATDVAADYPITLSYSGNVNVIVSASQIDNSTWNITFSAPANWFGSELITFTATNKDASTAFPVQVNVISVNDVPELNAIGPQSVIEDSTFGRQVVAADNDTTDTLIYSINAPAGMDINSTGWINWTPTNLNVGSHNVTVYVTDGIATTQTTFTITVLNNPTIISNCPAGIQQAASGILYGFDINSTDEGFGDIFTFTQNPAGMTINPATGLIAWIPLPSNAGLNAVAIQVNDGHGAMPSCAYFINVTQPGNRSVMLTATPPSQSVPVNNTASYTLTVTNVGTLSDNYTIYYINLNGATINPIAPTATGVLFAGQTFSPSMTVMGSNNITYNVNVTVVSNTDPSVNMTITVPTTFTASGVLDTTAPAISVVSVIAITNVSATIVWNTNESADSTVRFGTTTSLTGGVAGNIAFVLGHNVPLSGLLPNRTYYFNVTSCDPSANCATLGPYNFTTLANGVTPPTGQTIVNSWINGRYYPLNYTYQVPGSGMPDNITRVINSNLTFTNTMRNSSIENASPVKISGGLSNNCIVENKPFTSTSGCVDVYVDPSQVILNNPTGSRFWDSDVMYYNVTYSLVSLSYIRYSYIDHSTIQNSSVEYCTIKTSGIEGSNLMYCKVINSTVNNSTVNNSNITNCTISGSILNGAKCEDNTIINSTINSTDICGGIVNGVPLGTMCVKIPVISLNVPSSAYNGDSVGMSGQVTNNGTGNNTPPYTYVWSFGDSTGASPAATNSTSNSQSHSYSANGNYDVKLKVVNSLGISATVHSTIAISTKSSDGDHHNGGSTSTGTGKTSGMITYTGKNLFQSLGGSQCMKSKTVYADQDDVISLNFNNVTYTIDFTAETNRSADMIIYPGKKPVTLFVRGSTIVDLNGDKKDDLSIILNDIVRDVDTSGFVRWKMNMTLKLVNCPEQKAPAEAVKEAVQQAVTDVASGVLNVIGSITPAPEASPVIGSAVTAGIILVGLGGYFGFRKRKPKL